MSSPAHWSRTASPQLLTPNGSPPNPNHIALPPTFSEARLAQLLSNFDHGTHSFDRAERETPEERRMSFGEAMGHGVDRRQSFLSALSLSRPGFGFASSPTGSTIETPLHTPLSGTYLAYPLPPQPYGKDAARPPLSMSKSTGMIDSKAHFPPLDSTPGAKGQSVSTAPALPAQSGVKPPAEMQRANTAPQKTLGFKAKHDDMEQCRFDPSKEPRLLSLL